MNEHLVLAKDLCARLCRDVGGPLEVLISNLEGKVGATELLASVRAIEGRLRLWQVVTGQMEAPVDRAAMSRLLSDARRGGGGTTDLSGLSGGYFPVSTVRAVLAAAMLGQEALRGTGTVHVAGDAAGVAIWPEGPGAAWPHAFTAGLASARSAEATDMLVAQFLSLATEAGLDASLVLGGSGAAPPLALRRRANRA